MVWGERGAAEAAAADAADAAACAAAAGACLRGGAAEGAEVRARATPPGWGVRLLACASQATEGRPGGADARGAARGEGSGCARPQAGARACGALAPAAAPAQPRCAAQSLELARLGKWSHAAWRVRGARRR